ncbi:MAG: DNA-3-methyladenine glycosylase [Polyangiaceae bacterium]
MNRFSPLPRAFYARAAIDVARDCIGQLLVHEREDELLTGRIVEAEAYVGVEDRACHAYGGHRSARNESMFGPPGHAYVFLIYGLHFHLNLVVSTPEDPSAVLLRAVEPLEGEVSMSERRKFPKNRVLLTNGPGKLCQAFGIDCRFDGVDLCSGRLYLAKGIAPKKVLRVPRIGVDYAGAWANEPLRYLDAQSPFVSVMPKRPRSRQRG